MKITNKQPQAPIKEQLIADIEIGLEELSDEELNQVVGGHGTGGWIGFAAVEHGSGGWIGQKAVEHGSGGWIGVQ